MGEVSVGDWELQTLAHVEVSLFEDPLPMSVQFPTELETTIITEGGYLARKVCSTQNS